MYLYRNIFTRMLTTKQNEIMIKNTTQWNRSTQQHHHFSLSLWNNVSSMYVLSSVTMSFEVEVQLQHSSFKDTLEATLLAYFPLVVNDFERYVFIGRSRVDSDQLKDEAKEHTNAKRHNKQVYSQERLEYHNIQSSLNILESIK